MRSLIQVIFVALVHTVAYANEFNVESLPAGAEVTIPGNTQTVIGPQSRVRLSPTESVQTLRFTAIATHGKIPHVMKVAIFDRTADRVKKVTLAPNTPFLYSFQRMRSIDVLSESGVTPFSALLLESDKPISIAK